MIGFNICSANRLISGFKIDGLGKEIYAMNLVLYTPFLSNLGIIFVGLLVTTGYIL